MRRQRLFLYCLIPLSLLAAVLALAERWDVATQPDILGAAPDQYGYAVAVTDTTAIVGQPRARREGVSVGAVHIYERQGQRWDKITRLRPTDEPAPDLFGSAVAIHEDTALIGAPGSSRERGAAYIFERRHGVWTRLSKLTARDADRKDAFGQAVALLGDYALVGAPGDDAAGQDAGAVYVFHRHEGVWNRQAVHKLLPSDAAPHTGFGAALAMAEGYAVIGAPQHDHGGLTTNDYGAVYVFALQHGQWSERTLLQAGNSAPKDAFGSAVALAGLDIVIGAPGHRGRGAAYVFTRQGPDWTEAEARQLMASDGRRGDRFGNTIALSSVALLIGAYSADAQNQVKAALQDKEGAVYVFERQDTGWVEATKLTDSPTQPQAHFGYAIALAGPHALIGAPALLGGPDGQVYAYSTLETNALPEIQSTPGTTATVDTLYRYQVQATDADGDALRYSLLRAPTGMVINKTRGLLAWTPAAPGAVDVEITVHDDRGGVVTQTYTLVVHTPNQPPRITSTPVRRAVLAHLIPHITISEAHVLRQTITLNDQPYMLGTPISTPGDYTMTVEVIDITGHTTRKTVHFTLAPPDTP